MNDAELIQAALRPLPDSWKGMPIFTMEVPAYEHLQSVSSDTTTVNVTLSGHTEKTWHLGRTKQTRVWGPGTTTLIRAGVEMTHLSSTGGHTISGAVLDRAWIDSLLQDDVLTRSLLVGAVPPHLVDHHQGVRTALVAMHLEAAAGCTSGQLYAQSLSLTLLQRLAERHGLAIARKSPASWISFQKALRYIEDHLHEDLSITELAQISGTRPQTLTRDFKRMTGSSIYHHVLLRRVERAKPMLKRKGTSVTEVAMALGFSSPSHFSSTFTNIVGCSPRKYRST